MIRRALYIFSLIAAVSGCTLGTEQSALSGATFRVESTGGSAVDETVIAKWNIPTERRFNFNVCVRNLAGRNDIHNHPFEILGEGGRAYRTSTDGLGCAHWTEIIGFDYLAQPTYVRLKRVIRSVGVQRGEVEFLLAINPWSGLIGSEPAVVDINFGRNTVPRIADMDLGASALRAASNRRTELEIESVSYELQMNSPKANQDAVLHLEFSPALVLKRMSGETERKKLERGVLEVTPYLLRLNDDGTKTLINNQISPVSIELKNGIAIFHQGIKFSGAKLDPQGIYKLALVVSATTGPNYIATYNRMYDIPNFSALQGATLSLSSGAEAEINVFDTSAGAPKILGLRENSDEGARFFVVNKINGMNNGLIDETMMQRRVRLSMSADVRWAANLAPMQGRRFVVYSMQKDFTGKFRKIVPKGESDASGSLFWEDEIIHNMYQIARRHRFDVVIEDSLTQQKVTRCVSINPWDFWATFFRDCNEINDTYEQKPDGRLVAPVPKAPLLKIDSLSMSRTDSAISDADILSMIKPDLSLETKHRYNLALGASILRFDDLRTGMQTPAEAMRGGWWLLSVAIYRNSPGKGTVGDAAANGELKPVITFEKAICNPGTAPAAEIEIPVLDLSLMDRNNYMAVQLLPLKQDKLKFVENASASPDGAYCSGLRVAPDSPIELYSSSDKDDLGRPVVELTSPAYIAPMNLRTGGSPVVISHDNFVDPRLIALDRQLKTKTIHEIHLAAEMERAARKEAERARLAKEKREGWSTFAKDRGLVAVELKNDDGFQAAFPNVVNPGHEVLFNSLACLDEDFWADQVHQARCTLDPVVQAASKTLCQLASALAGDGTKCENLLSELLVEEKVHVYAFSEANYAGGFQTSLPVSSSFALGSFNGSDFGHALSDTASAGVNAGAGISKGPVSVGIEGGFSKSTSSINVNFTREWSDNQVGVSTAASLTVENADINIKLSEYRRCYIVKTRATRDKGYYLCNKVETEPWWRAERYFSIFNPGFNGSILNTNDERNRWLMQFRGERTFYHLLASINMNFAPFNLDGNPILLTDIMKRTYGKYAERTGWGDPYVLSTLAPGQDTFERIEGTIRSLGIFNPFNHFGNVPLRDQNDPNLRVHENDSKFGQE